jgi:hypothetical protein
MENLLGYSARSLPHTFVMQRSLVASLVAVVAGFIMSFSEIFHDDIAYNWACLALLTFSFSTFLLVNYVLSLFQNHASFAHYQLVCVGGAGRLSHNRSIRMYVFQNLVH